jgi:hypothetical protein
VLWGENSSEEWKVEQLEMGAIKGLYTKLPHTGSSLSTYRESDISPNNYIGPIRIQGPFYINIEVGKQMT